MTIRPQPRLWPTRPTSRPVRGTEVPSQPGWRAIRPC
jgi:hypothetical protein